MSSVAEVLAVLLPLLYAAAAGIGVRLFAAPRSPLARLALPWLGATVGLHAVALCLRAVTERRCPLGTIGETVGMIAFVMALVYLALELRGGRRSTGVLILPMVFGLELLALLAPQPSGPPNPALKDPLFSLHSAAAVVAVAALAVSFVYGVFYLLLYRQIATHRFGLLFRRLPALTVLGRMCRGSAVIGWAALTVLIVAGYARGYAAGRGAEMARDPLLLASDAVWLLYGVALGVRYLLGWRGRYSVIIIVSGFALLLVAMTVMTLAFPSLHSFG